MGRYGRPYLLLTVLILPFALPSAAQQVKDTCYECHLGLKGKLQRPAKIWEGDVHRRHGLTCTVCHNGDPTVADQNGSKGPNFVPFFEHDDVPKLCGRCHPGVSEGASSVHAKVRAAGAKDLPNCIDCHSIHDTRPAAELSTAASCGKCHEAAAEQLKAGSHQAMLAGQGGECGVCHGAHKAAAAPAPGCTQCHEAASPEAKQGARMVALISGLRAELAKAGAGKKGAEALAKARVAVHSFSLPEVEKAVKEASTGLKKN